MGGKVAVAEAKPGLAAQRFAAGLDCRVNQLIVGRLVRVGAPTIDVPADPRGIRQLAQMCRSRVPAG